MVFSPSSRQERLMARSSTKRRSVRSANTRTKRRQIDALARPLATHNGTVLPEWIDYNGHMNLSYYVLLFDSATDGFLEYLGLTPGIRVRRNASTFSAEMHVHYLRELRVGDPVRITTQLLDHDARRIHYFHRMYHRNRGYLAATNELLSLYVDMGARRVTEMPPAMQRRLAALGRAHERLSRPEQSGSIIGICRGAETPRRARA